MSRAGASGRFVPAQRMGMVKGRTQVTGEKEVLLKQTLKLLATAIEQLDALRSSDFPRIDKAVGIVETRMEGMDKDLEEIKAAQTIIHDRINELKRSRAVHDWGPVIAAIVAAAASIVAVVIAATKW